MIHFKCDICETHIHAEQAHRYGLQFRIGIGDGVKDREHPSAAGDPTMDICQDCCGLIPIKARTEETARRKLIDFIRAGMKLEMNRLREHSAEIARHA